MMGAAWFNSFLKNSGGNRFDWTQLIHAQLSFSIPTIHRMQFPWHMQLSAVCGQQYETPGPREPCSEIPAHRVEQMTILSPTGSCSPPFAAMQRRGECYRTYPLKHSLTFRKMSAQEAARTAAKHWPCECGCMHFKGGFGRVWNM